MGLIPQFDSAWALGRVIEGHQMWLGAASVWSCRMAVAGETLNVHIANSGLLGKLNTDVRYALYGRFRNAKHHCIEIERATPVVELAGLIDPTSGHAVADSVVDLIESFHALVDTITQPELREFVRDAMALPEIRSGYCTAAASKRNHHAFPGGLLHHSLEAAKFFIHAAESSGSIQTWERDLGLIVALFHDVGKLADPRSLDRKIRSHLQHEAASVRLLEPALDALEAKLPEYAQHLRYQLWGHREIEGESGWLRLCLRFADQASACQNNEAIARREGFRHGDHLILHTDGPKRSFYSPRLPEALA